MNCPTIAAVPGIHQDLTIKATASGITTLVKSRYKIRYTGSKGSYIDINGKLYIDKKKFKPEVAEEQKKRRPKKATRKIERIEAQRSENFSTSEPQLSPKKQRLSTSYSVNKREVRQRILGYINTMRGKRHLYFWTVTFPAGTKDDACYMLFNVWLTQLRKKKMLRDYLWVAERQPLQTKTIHFHIAIPHTMDVIRANSMMRETLYTYIKRGLVPFSLADCYKYNGVHISKNRKTGRVVNFAIKKGARALATYLTKYVTKNDEQFTHLAWHNSRGYSAVFTGITFTLQEFEKFGFFLFVDKRDNRKLFIGDFAEWSPWINGPPPQLEQHLFQLNSFIQEKQAV